MAPGCARDTKCHAIFATAKEGFEMSWVSRVSEARFEPVFRLLRPSGETEKLAGEVWLTLKLYDRRVHGSFNWARPVPALGEGGMECSGCPERTRHMRNMRRICPTLAFVISIGLLASEGRSAEPDWARLIEFRDTIRPNTVPAVYASQGHLAVKAWKASERAIILRYLQLVVSLAPGMLERGAANGPIPFYRINEKECRGCQKGSSYGGHAALWFNKVHGTGNLNYLNIEASLYTLVHELTHVVDAEHKIVRSAEFRTLVEPRIAEVRARLKKKGWTWEDAHTKRRYDIAYDAGLPSAYAADTIQETLAEYVAVTLLYKDFSPPPEIMDFLKKHVFSNPSSSDPSVPLFRRGKRLLLEKKFDDALRLLTEATKLDPKFAEVFSIRGYASTQRRAWNEAIGHYSRFLELTSEYDWKRANGYFNRGLSYLHIGKPESALADYKEAKRLLPSQAQTIDRAIKVAEKFLRKRKK